MLGIRAVRLTLSLRDTHFPTSFGLHGPPHFPEELLRWLRLVQVVDERVVPERSVWTSSASPSRPPTEWSRGLHRTTGDGMCRHRHSMTGKRSPSRFPANPTRTGKTRITDAHGKAASSGSAGLGRADRFRRRKPRYLPPKAASRRRAPPRLPGSPALALSRVTSLIPASRFTSHSGGRPSAPLTQLA